MFLHTFHPQPLVFEIGFLKIHWYGLIIAIAVLIGLLVVIKLNKKYKEKKVLIFKNKDQILDLCFYLIIFGLIGARIYAVFLFPQFYIKDPLAIFKIWNGGLAVHGALFAGIFALILFSKKHKTDLYLSLDLIAPVMALGHAIGRWGNYFNQELFGLPTKLPWGIPIDLAHRPQAFQGFNFFHPTFLYESLLNLILAGILIFLHYRRLNKLKESKTKPNQKGNIFLIYLIGYSLIRFSLEFIKIDETPLMFGLRLPQLISLILIIAAGVVFLKKKKLVK
jgi:phosphatidylglycerol:prolipoprotein diacylglycerol transferase